MYHTSPEEPGLQPRRCDTLNRGPPSTSQSHRAIPMRAAQISSAIHSVFQARQLITSGRTPRPILPAQANGARVSRALPSPSIPRIDQVGDSSPSSSPFVMFETENRPESRPSASHDNNKNQRIQSQSQSPAAMGPLEERSSNRTRNPTDADWNQYRSIITRLYWDENLSMPVVRDYMKREHGFDATYVQSCPPPSCPIDGVPI